MQPEPFEARPVMKSGAAQLVRQDRGQPERCDRKGMPVKKRDTEQGCAEQEEFDRNAEEMGDHGSCRARGTVPGRGADPVHITTAGWVRRMVAFSPSVAPVIALGPRPSLSNNARR